MPQSPSVFTRLSVTTIVFAAGTIWSSAASAQTPKDKYPTLCTATDLCYCVNPDYKTAIDANIIRVRKLIEDNKAQGKSIGYLSVPISSAGGGYLPYNQTIVARKTTEAVDRRFGSSNVWILNPGDEGSHAMQGASGADYMYMWTTILEGRQGNGEDFDFFYFVGPSDFEQALNLPAKGTLEALDAYFDARLADDPKFKSAVDSKEVTKIGFRNYYGLRAAVSFSLGSHDEWNIARILNERRRGIAGLGIPGQIAIFFDGHAVAPGSYEQPLAIGDVGRCIK